MRLIPVECLQEGQIIAKDILDENGSRLLAKDTRFKSFYRQKLEERGIGMIYISDELSEGIEIRDVIPQQVRLEALTSIKNVASLFHNTKKIDIEKIHISAQKIIDSVLSNRELLYDMVDIKSKDNYTYYHSINVSILCVMLGIKTGANKEYLKKLAIGGILHDFGKILIPDSILNKPDKLSEEEYEIIRQHPLQGYQILKEHPLLTPISKVMILLHHERINGKGYPLGLSKSKLHEGARICSICDIFDAMTSKRVYKDPFTVVHTLNEMNEMADTELDGDLLKIFRSIIAYYPVGTTVLLNNSNIAIIEKNRAQSLDTPIVRMIFNLKEQKEIFHTIDLSQHKNIKIEREIMPEEYMKNPSILKAMKI